MSFLGTVRNGVVILDDPQGIPEGTPVVVTRNHELTVPYTLGQRLVALAESVPDAELPDDLSLNHDRYRRELTNR